MSTPPQTISPIREEGFEKEFKRLPSNVQSKVPAALANPRSPQYRFHKLTKRKGFTFRDDSRAIWLTQQYRAVAQEHVDGRLAWYWCGPHSEYDHKCGKKSRGHS